MSTSFAFGDNSNILTLSVEVPLFIFVVVMSEWRVSRVQNIFTVFFSVESELPRSVGLNCIPISRHLCEGMHVDTTLT